jgi:hypothetical protein
LEGLFQKSLQTSPKLFKRDKTNRATGIDFANAFLVCFFMRGSFEKAPHAPQNFLKGKEKKIQQEFIWC